MSKAQYLSTAHVQNFIDWLAINLSDPEKFKHGYVNRRSGIRVSYKGLSDALSQYIWPHLETMGAPSGETLASNGAALNALQEALVYAVSSNNDAAVCNAASEVMRWGGVANGNIQWLHENEAGLANLINKVATVLSEGDWQHPIIQSDNLRFNAGMTKVYSLLVNDFIIYDSRVAAALGWLVVHYCQDKGLSSVPVALRFPWAPSRIGQNAPNPTNRNPGLGNGYTFPRLRSGRNHAEWNLKASWVLHAVLQKSGANNPFTIKGEIAPLRRLEAALFMIGYDLGGGEGLGADAGVGQVAPVTVRALRQGNPEPIGSATSAMDNSEWARGYTPTRRNEFFFRKEPNGYRVQNGPFFSWNTINEILDKLQEQFGTGVFPLSNNVIEVPRGNAIPGLGTIYYEVTNGRGNPAHTSHLTAILLGLKIFTSSTGLRGWRLNQEGIDEFRQQLLV